jgi:2-oxoglutarate ferredoxin oxidoreductase subunit alpha
MREKVTIPPAGELEVVQRLRTSVPEGIDYHPYLPREDGRLPMSDFGGVHRYNVTGLVHDMWGFPSNDPAIAYELLHHLVDKIENHSGQLARFQEHHCDDAQVLLISYGSAARSALHLVEDRRGRGFKLGLLELNTLWPFPGEVVRRHCEGKSHVLVVEMNRGQIFSEVKKAVTEPDRVYLANRYDGALISHNDIQQVLHVVMGKGV